MGGFGVGVGGSVGYRQTAMAQWHSTVAQKPVPWPVAHQHQELDLKLTQTHMTQKPVLRAEVGACRFAQQTSTAKKE